MDADLSNNNITTPEGLGYELQRMCNTFGTIGKAEKLATYLLTCHRTLQQSVVRFFVEVMVEMGKRCEAPYTTDARNEQAIQFCKRLGTMKDNGEIGLPMV